MILKLLTMAMLFTSFAKPLRAHYSSIKSHSQQFHPNGLPPNSVQAKFMASKSALFIVAEGSEELELVAPVDILRRVCMKVVIADLADSEHVKTKNNLLIKTDAKLSDVKNTLFDAVVIPGGPSYTSLAASSVVGDILRNHEKSGKVVAAICAAPFVLFKHGIAKGKNVTSYPSVKSDIEGFYNYKEISTVVDGNLVTSRGPGTAIDFGLNLVELMLGNEVKVKVADAFLHPL